MRLKKIAKVYSAVTNLDLLVFIIPTKYIGSRYGLLSLECVVIFEGRIII